MISQRVALDLEAPGVEVLETGIFGLTDLDNPLAEGAGATFDVEDSSAVATNTSGVVSVPSRSTNPDSSDSDSGSSEYEWHTTDEESGGEDDAADGAAPNGAAAPPNGLTPQKSDDM